MAVQLAVECVSSCTWNHCPDGVEYALRQRPRNESGGLAVFGAGKAVGKHRPCAGSRLRRVEPSGKGFALAAGKFNALTGHAVSPFKVFDDQPIVRRPAADTKPDALPEKGDSQSQRPGAAANQ